MLSRLIEIIINSKANSNSTNVKNVHSLTIMYYFDMNKLSKYKEEIESIIDKIMDSGEEKMFWDFSIYEENERKMSYYESELVLLLGLALDLISYTTSVEEWNKLPGGLPIIVRNEKERILST